MKTHTVSIAEGKKDFSKLINEAAENHEDIVVTKRGKPVAVIVSFEDYKLDARHRAYLNILKLREQVSPPGVTSEEILQESKDELERRSRI
ncbi:MAG: type II toxin-antitoxin system Phd/YefM family antitoxin [Planctomycetes bacterium]|nr:type II toxin-antitoxin system Phd/YefM family antitoxin [Planctomycetota bacterium]